MARWPMWAPACCAWLDRAPRSVARLPGGAPFARSERGGDARAARGRDDPPPARPASRGSRAHRGRVLDAALDPARGRRGEVAGGARRARPSSASRAPGKYLVWELSDDALPAHASADDRHAAVRPAGRPAPHPRPVRARRRPPAASTSTRAASAPATCSAAGRRATAYLGEPARRRAAHPGVHRRVPAPRWHAGAPRRSRRSCSISGGSPASATSTPTRRCSARGSTRCGAAGSLTRAQSRRCARRSRRRWRPGSTPRARRSTTSAIVDGAYGSFQDRFLVHLREGGRASRCGTPVRKLVVGGRGTYVCERCQPRPRRRRRGPRGEALGGEELGSRPARSAARSSWKPPIDSPSITIWGKVIHAGLRDQLVTAVRVPCEIDLGVLDLALGQQRLGARAERTMLGGVHGDWLHDFTKYSK